MPLGGIVNQRSLIHVDNLAQFLSLCVDHPDAANEIFHVRDRADYSVADILAGVGDSLGRSPRMVRIPGSLLRLSAKATGKAEALKQLTGWLQVDDSHARKTIQFMPADLPFGSS